VDKSCPHFKEEVYIIKIYLFNDFKITDQKIKSLKRAGFNLIDT
jgi:hypothetical protein